jgi:iron complex outermembrane recepter protein
MPFIARNPVTAVARVVATALGLTVLTAQADETTAQPVTVFNAADVEARGLVALDGIASAVPEISWTRGLNSFDTLSLYLRGEGPTAPGQVTLDGAVGIYQDGFLVSRLQANTFDLLDLERVEVISGPQGALYGRDTAGGVLNLTSRAPTGQLGFNQQVSFGNRNSYRIMSSLDAPSWHGISAKGTVLVSGGDGWVNNAAAQLHDFGSDMQRGARLQLKWDALDSLHAGYFVERSNENSTPEYPQVPPLNGTDPGFGYTYYANPDGPQRTSYRAVNLPLSTANHTAQGLTLSWHPGSALTVESRTGYRTMSADEEMDYVEFYDFPEASVDLYSVGQFTQDLRLSGELFDRQLRYTVGGSYLRENAQHTNDFIELSTSAFYSNLVVPTYIRSNTRSVAEYASLSFSPAFWGLDRRLELNVAGRYTRDEKEATRWIYEEPSTTLEDDARAHISYSRPTPEGSIVWHWNDAVSTYIKLSTGYIAGGALENAPIDLFTASVFRPETNSTYEVGLRSALMDDKLHADVAVFYSRRKDVQYAAPENISQQVFEVFDLQRVTVKGASFDVSYQPLTDLTLRASGTYLDWRINWAEAMPGTVFDPAAAAGSPYVVGQNVSSAFALPYTPKYAGSLSGDYTALHLDRAEVLLHLDYVYRGRMFVDAGSGPAVPGGTSDTQQTYGLLGGRITLSQETDWAHRVKWSVWGNNLLDKKYYQPAVGVGGGISNYSAVGVFSGFIGRAGAWAEPRTYGLAIRYEY